MLSVFMIPAFRLGSPVRNVRNARNVTNMGSVKRLLAFACLAAAALGAVACDKVPLLAPTGSTIVLTSAANALPSGGKTTLVAQVLEASGTVPHSGTQVTFTTTLGTVSPSQTTT